MSNTQQVGMKFDNGKPDFSYLIDFGDAIQIALNRQFIDFEKFTHDLTDKQLGNEFVKTFLTYKNSKKIYRNSIDSNNCNSIIVFENALGDVCRVAEFGAKKYKRGNWLYVEDSINRYTAAMFRHYLKQFVEPWDAESTLSHKTHRAWNALARLQLLLNETQNLEHINIADVQLAIICLYDLELHLQQKNQL